MGTHWRKAQGYTLTELIVVVAIACFGIMAIYGAFKGLQLINAAIHYLSK